MNNIKEWKYNEARKVWELWFCPFYDEELVAELYKDDCGDWWIDSKVMDLEEAYIDDFNDHECLEVIQMRVEEMLYEYYMEESEYYKGMAGKLRW